MRRVVVIGPSGSGKTTVARQLAAVTRLPLIHLDSLFWKPGWVPTQDAQWAATVTELVENDTWILDGNYPRTLAARLSACDTVLLLDPPPLVCLWRVLLRHWRYRGSHLPELPAACSARLTFGFVWRILGFRSRERPWILKHLNESGSAKRLLVLRNDRDVQRMLSAVRQDSA